MQIPGVHWPTSLAETVSCQFSERPYLESLRRKTPPSASGISMHTHGHTQAHTHVYTSPTLLSAEQIMGKRGLVVNYKLLAQMPAPTFLPPANVHFLGSQSGSTSAHPTPAGWLEGLCTLLPRAQPDGRPQQANQGSSDPTQNLQPVQHNSCNTFTGRLPELHATQTKTVTLARLSSALESWPETKCQGEMETSVPDPIPASRLPRGCRR